MSPAWALCREARGQARLSQRELASRAGVSPSTVARIEMGRMEPTLALLLRLVHACGLELRLRLSPPAPTDAPLSLTGLDARLEELKRLSLLTPEVRQSSGA
ncbi:MAG TPA: helix-turn-helix transcriptional regulator [Acidimicrobiales bacterium]|jgi:transcriptional regulator with XRE-family HTH domain|nr:helix-turn-helix transcriptional regulator [Acidimicrobiales bacterium]